MQKISFYDQISRNKIKSIILMIVIIAVFAALAYIIGLIYQQDAFLILIVGIIVSIFYVLISYYNSDKIALASAGAKEAEYSQYRQLHHIVEGLCLASGMPKPKIYVMPGNQINAFASGRDPEHSVVCVTEVAVEKLDKQELEGILGHELSHIASYDIRFMTLVAVMVGMIAIISQIFLRSMWFKGSGGNSRDNRAGAVLVVIGIILAILAPIVVQLVQLAISRKREYAADASSVKFTRSPTGLIKALQKIKKDDKMLKISGALAPLFISDPFKKAGNLFQTHPPIEKRIQILERM